MKLMTVKEYLEIKFSEKGKRENTDKDKYIYFSLRREGYDVYVFTYGSVVFKGTYIELMEYLELNKEIIEETNLLVPTRMDNAWKVSNFVLDNLNPLDDKELLYVGDLSYFDDSVYQVFYHAHCNDGMGAAVEYYNTYKAKSYFRAIAYGTKIDKIKMNDDVTKALFLDFCPSKELVEFLLNEKKLESIFILDHHKTALETIKGYGELLDTGKIKYFVQQDQSGAMLSYNVDFNKFLNGDIVDVREDDNLLTNMSYEFPKEDCCAQELKLNQRSFVEEMVETLGGELRPKTIRDFYKLLDVRDRWVIEDTHEKERADALAFYLVSKDWYSLRVKEAAKLLEGIKTSDIADFIKAGHSLEDFNDIMSKDAIKGALKLRLETHNGINLNVAFSYTTIKISNAGFLWTLDNPGEKSLFVGVHINRNDTVSLSMRSDSTYSARAVAERLVEKGICHTGGGHDQAAGATMKYPEDGLNLDWLQEQVINTIIELEVEQEPKEEE